LQTWVLTCFLTLQDEEIKEKTAKIEHAEMCLTTLKLELKVSFFGFLEVFVS
jgi:hypothetical protein